MSRLYYCYIDEYGEHEVDLVRSYDLPEEEYVDVPLSIIAGKKIKKTYKPTMMVWRKKNGETVEARSTSHHVCIRRRKVIYDRKRT